MAPITYVCVLNWGFEISGAGTFRVAHNTVIMAGAHLEYSNIRVVLVSVNENQRPASLSESSSLYVANNTVEAGADDCFLVYMGASNSSITGGSAIFLQNNYFPRVMGASPFIHLLSFFTPAYIAANSTIYISNNTVFNDMGFVMMLEMDREDVSFEVDGARLVIQSNRMERMGSTNASDPFKAEALIRFIFVKVTKSLRVFVLDNNITFRVVDSGGVLSGRGFMYVVALRFRSYPSLSEPLLLVRGNIVTGIGNTQTRGGEYGCFIAFLHSNDTVLSPVAPLQFPDVEAVRIDNNSITTTNFNTTDIMQVTFTSHVDPIMATLTNNTVVSDPTSTANVATLSLVSEAPLFSIRTCGNVANNNLCQDCARYYPLLRI